MQLKIVFAFFAVVIGSAMAQTASFEPYGSCGANGSSGCKLQCLFFQKYVDGTCDENNVCQCKTKATLGPATGPQKIGACGAKGDTGCQLQCLFYPKFGRGFCDASNNCMCELKARGK